MIEKGTNVRNSPVTCPAQCCYKHWLTTLHFGMKSELEPRKEFKNTYIELKCPLILSDRWRIPTCWRNHQPWWRAVRGAVVPLSDWGKAHALISIYHLFWQTVVTVMIVTWLRNLILLIYPEWVLLLSSELLYVVCSGLWPEWSAERGFPPLRGCCGGCVAATSS